MEKKTIYYIVGGIAVLGIAYYLYNKSKKPATEKEATDETTKTDVATDVATEDKAITPVTAPTPVTPTSTTPAPKKLTAQELESKLAGCGKKPKLKKNQTLWNNCRNDMTAKLKSQGLVAFDGSYYFEGVAEKNIQNTIREKSFAQQVTNREDGRLFAGRVYNN
jgi:hypothetical protein